MPRVSEATKSEHRQRLLEAAAREFAAKGLSGARIDDISLAAGLAKGTIYNYFDSKEDVFRAVVGEWARRTAEAREDNSVEGPIRDRLFALATADLDVVAEMEEFARTALREILTQPPELLALVVPAWDTVDAQVIAMMTDAAARGELRSDRSTEELARLYFVLENGLLFEHWLPGGPTLAEIPDLVVDYFLEGARPTGR